MTNHSHRPALAAAAAALLLNACSSDDGGPAGTPAPPTTAPVTALDRLDALGLDDFAALVRASSFESVLENGSSVTVFAPTDAALAALGGWPAGASDFSAPGAADAIVARAIAPGTPTEVELRALEALPTLAGDSLIVDVEPLLDEVSVDAAVTLVRDEGADAAVIHVVDAALHPPVDALTTLELRGMDTLRDAIATAGLEAEVESGALTVLAPDEGAFAALGPAALADLLAPGNEIALAERLRFHLIPTPLSAAALDDLVARETSAGPLALFSPAADGALTVNGARVTLRNQPTTTGVVHAIDAVLEVPPTFGELVLVEGLTAFEGLLFASGLGAEFDAQTPMTAFVPDNQAFGALPPSVLDMLVDPANVNELRDTLRGHAVTVARPASLLVAGDVLPTLNAGGLLALEDDGAGGVLVDGVARVVTEDLFFDHGVVHVIDVVLY